MFQVNDRSEGMIRQQILQNIWIFLGKRNEHDESTLTMTHIVNSLASSHADVIEGCGKIVLGHLVKGVIPIIAHMFAQILIAVSISSNITHPYVKTLIC